ncbi:IS5 family transposase [Azospirillum melinis]|uniref:IS5 family transposase n=1 Tax=Azospirillum melinis TaxID=328839 RepID=A0ABX2KKU8_9PROT|nr:IS5 family transposase [Azospirillum melinis]MBP2309734.1 transposase [Azospirillum melinis]NUB01252.1 IS5 family transposase [Azospirillum melinis]
MPRKANAARRHHIRRPKRRVMNWATYDAALRQRGSLTVWFTDAAIASWRAAPRTTPGGQPNYSDLAITTALMLRAVFHLALRQTEGLIGSILHLLGLDLPVPDHSTIARRARTVTLPATPRSTSGPLHLLVDSTGLKLGGPGEWLIEKHGTKKRRSWKKLHIGVDAAIGRIVAATLTDRDVDDAAQVAPLLDRIGEPVASLTGDGAYDRTAVYAAVHERHPDAAVVAPPRLDAVLSDTAAATPTQRDRHILAIAETGRMAWQRDSRYNQRAKVEGQIGRWKQVVGPALRFHTDQAQATEVAIAVAVLNRMLDLGRPHSVRIA